MKLDSVLITAYAPAPKGTAFYERFGYMGVILEIDKKTDKIVSASVTLMTKTAKQYTEKLLVGENFGGDISELIKDIESQYLAVSQTSLIAALKKAQQRYLNHKSADRGIELKES